MKYLLSILVLFSGLSFSYDFHFICDEPYTFYPDKNKRWLIRMDGTEVDMFKLSPDKYQFFDWNYDDLRITDAYYSWDSVYLISEWKLDRETLMLNSKYKCKVVGYKEWGDALREIDAIVKKTKEKRKI
tara:strand:- start:67 stop:453 length:387 start_codon:yes stop_codon:yes gene_type:complete